MQHRLAFYRHLIAPRGHADAAHAVLGNVVRAMATTQAVIDGFVLVAGVALLGLTLFVLIVPSPPRGPASHTPISWRKNGS